MQRTAIVLAGGLGTRLRSVVANLPKPMAPVAGVPFLQHVFMYLQKQNIARVVLAVGYKYESIQSYFGKKFETLQLDYSIENEPLGTGGGIRKAMQLVNENCFLLNGDTFFDVDLAALENFARSKNAKLALALKPMKNFNRYGTVVLDADKRITHFEEKKNCAVGLINGGVYFAQHDLLAHFPQLPEKFSFEKDVLEAGVKRLHYVGFVQQGYFIDIGIPEEFAQAQIDFARNNKN